MMTEPEQPLGLSDKEVRKVLETMSFRERLAQRVNAELRLYRGLVKPLLQKIERLESWQKRNWDNGRRACKVAKRQNGRRKKLKLFADAS